MQAFLEPFHDLADIEMLRDALKTKGQLYELTGCIEIGKAHVIYGIGHDYPWKLVVAEDEQKARAIYEEYQFYEDDCVYYPAKDMLFYQSDIHSNELTKDRIRALKALTTQDHGTFITTVEALMNRIPSQEALMESVIRINIDSEVDLQELRQKLTNFGYEQVAQVETWGQFAVRGGIFDVFPLTEDMPLRVELWGDDVDSMRQFDPGTQKSLEDVEEVAIYPAMEMIVDSEGLAEGLRRMEADADEMYEQYRKEMKTEAAHRIRSSYEEIRDKIENGWGIQEIENHLLYFTDQTYSLIEYLPKDTLVFLDEPSHLEANGHVCEQEFAESMLHREASGYSLPQQKHMLFSADEVLGRCANHPGVLLSMMETKKGSFKSKARFYIHMTSVTSYSNSFELLCKELRNYRNHKYRSVIVSASRTRAKRLADDLMDEGLNAYYTENANQPVYPGEVMVTVGGLRRGFDYPDARFVYISENDIFGQNHLKKKRKKKKAEDHIRSLQELSPGDYVVHENYGLGIYQGMEKIEVDHVMKDYIKIAYAKKANLYILATQMDMISKYGNAGDKKPKLSTLGTLEWSKTKSRVKTAVTAVAKDLVDLYALRQQNNGFVYGPDTVWQQEFEESFPYDETESQLEAIEDVKSDMMSNKIMDRLICGDVGYGKTEIAIRAAFKAVQENKQVVYLVPTTILAQQHYTNFVNRMKEYPINVEMLSRFRTTAENKETVKRLKKGEVDIVIGTHRVLSKDVTFKDLGLLIIDEEQRFGVTHKEKIKQMKKNVDVLSLSATPIPRTLHMSLVGIRDMSVLEEAPLERTPIQTFVFEYNEEMIREAIHREMARGGQVYYVINRVREIADVAAVIQKLVPEANIAYIHGQMKETEVEEIMTDFINKDIDVLVATTIIEIGLDISNVNTIIIHDADQLGLSQLYQLRGRVGRSNRTAFAFLMYRRNKMLKEVAEKRLAAIREFTDLGSGFKIAMRDLEIRGAGNMLGEAQHGHMEAVGYDLYCKLLNEAVRKEKGENVMEDFETSVDIAMDAFIPPVYIEDEEQKLEIYKRIAGVETEEEQQEMIEELIDRFGEPPKPVQNLLFVARLRSDAHRAYLLEIKQTDTMVRMPIYPHAAIDPSGIPGLIQKYQPYLEFVADKEAPAFYLHYKKNNRFPVKELPEYLHTLVQKLQGLVDNNS
ncbi:MAG: transcription-repair coupling factor [Lachnospiraceae bacterium]|nr:transcription-repair coupling factor [Lachnospiraceae bacterium]